MDGAGELPNLRRLKNLPNYVRILRLARHGSGTTLDFVSSPSSFVLAFLSRYLNTSDAPESVETLSRFGWLPGTVRLAWRILGSLVTSAFVHNALRHLAFNVYWLWVVRKP